MAKLATIAEAYDLDTNEAVTRLIDGFFSNPHTDVGRSVQQTLVTGVQAQQAAQMSQNPLIQIFQQLPPELQQSLMERVVDAVSGGKKGAPPF